MQFLELTLDTPEENLALDEALIETAERDPDFPETLRIWEPQSLMVVVGRSSRVSNETYSAICQQDGVPILRRTSGGTALVPSHLKFLTTASINCLRIFWILQMHFNLKNFI